MALKLSEQSVKAITSLQCSTRCPVCDRSDDTTKMETLLSCGHYACDVCVKKFVNASDKCYKCFAKNTPSDIKVDPYITNLVQSMAKLSRMANSVRKDHSDGNDKQVAKPKPQKTVPKTQKQLIIEGLKACSAKKIVDKAVDKEKENAKPNVKKSEMSKKTKKRAMIELTDEDSNDLDVNREVIPDSLEATQCSNLLPMDDHKKNKDPRKTFAEKSVQASIVDKKPVTTETAVQAVKKLISKQIQTGVEKTDASVQTVAEIAKPSASCDESKCCLHKIWSKLSAELNQCPTLDALLSALIVRSKSSDTLAQNTVSSLNICSEVTPDLRLSGVMSCNDKESDKDINDVKVEEMIATTEDRKLAVSLRPIDLNDFDIELSEIASDFNLQTKKSTKAKNSKPQQSDESSSDESLVNKIKNKGNTARKQVAIRGRRASSSGDKTNKKVMDNKDSKSKRPAIVEDLSDESSGEMQTVANKSARNVAKEKVVTTTVSTRGRGRRVAPSSRGKPALLAKSKLVEPTIIDEDLREVDSNKNKSSKANKSAYDFGSSDDDSVDIVSVPKVRKVVRKGSTKTDPKALPRNVGKSKQIKRKTKQMSSSSDHSDTDVDAKSDIIIDDSSKNKPSKANKSGSSDDSVDNVSVAKQIKLTKKVSPKTEPKALPRNGGKSKQVKRKIKQISSSSDQSDSDDDIFMDDSNESKTTVKSEQKSRARNKQQSKSPVKISQQSLKFKKSKNTELSQNDGKKTDNTVFKRPHSPSPSRSRSASNSSTNSRFRSQSGETSVQKKYYILIVALNETQRSKLQNIANRLGASNTVTDWCDSVTHLVSGLADEFPKKDLVAVRNLKYLQALMANNYIVSYDWIIASDQSDRFVDEGKYEIKGVRQYPTCNAPYKSRTAQNKFFDGYKVYFRKCFGSLSEDDLHNLVITGGGEVIRSEHELQECDKTAGKLVVVSEMIGTNTQSGIKFVTIGTFIDAISQYNSV